MIGVSQTKDFLLNDEGIEEVEAFVYLVSTINTQGNSTRVIKRRLAVARSATTKMENIWNNRNTHISLKLKSLRATAFANYRYESKGKRGKDSGLMPD